MPAAHDHGLCYLRAGWACQFRDLDNGPRVIVDVYIPGDVVGLDTALRARPLEDILMLTSGTVEAIPVRRSTELLFDPPTALYLTWLLGQQKRRADHLLTAVSGLDTRGRLATMILEFYNRLRRRKLITGLSYSLPLTQLQIARYLGLTVVHINRVLQSLRADRLIDWEKHCVTILDLERLTSLASQGGKLTVPSVSPETPLAVSQAA